MNRPLVILAMALVGASAAADEVLTGDRRLACEAIMCLASGKRPAECSASLERYFSISFSDWRDTIRGRIDFLNQCPGAQVSGEMSGLVSAMGNAAGRCDQQSLNLTMQTAGRACGDGRVIVIDDQLPAYCSPYYGHQYTDLRNEVPKYVGVPENGGFWSDNRNYSYDLAQYHAHSGKWNSESQCHTTWSPDSGNGRDADNTWLQWPVN